MTAILAVPTWLEGGVTFIAAAVFFFGTIFLLLSAVFGARMAYLLVATALFAFMTLLSALWTFGAPGTLPYLGPKGALPSWVAVAHGVELRSPTYPALQEYPGGPWQPPEEAGLQQEAEPAELAFQEFLAEEASGELARAGVEGEVTAEQFTVEDLRFLVVKGRELAAARAFAVDGGPEVMVFGYKDPGNEAVPSYVALVASALGFVVHLPFLDRAERRRKEILTGGDQPAWRGPA